MVTKRHGWLVGALADAGYQQQDLAKAWHCDGAVVSRFIAKGKPDLTPERQMILSQILGLTNDELLAKLYGSVSVRRTVAALPQPTEKNEVPADVQQQIEDHVRSLQALLPGAKITVNISYD
jgi:plasmid maintenance system antidote protein VapI